MKDQLQTLMSKEMSRQEFVQHIGAALLIMFGISGLLKSLTQHGTSISSNKQDMGYGASAYGGSN